MIGRSFAWFEIAEKSSLIRHVARGIEDYDCEASFFEPSAIPTLSHELWAGLIAE